MNHPPFTQILKQFAQLLVDGNFETAATMLDSSMQAEFNAESTRTMYEEMIEYGESPADNVEVITVLEDFPALTDGDLGWAYVAISGADWSEAVSGIVTKDEKIRAIEFGRP